MLTRFYERLYLFIRYLYRPSTLRAYSQFSSLTKYRPSCVLGAQLFEAKFLADFAAVAWLLSCRNVIFALISFLTNVALYI